MHALFPVPITSTQCGSKNLNTAEHVQSSGAIVAARAKALPCSCHMSILAPAGLSGPNRRKLLDLSPCDGIEPAAGKGAQVIAQI